MLVGLLVIEDSILSQGGAVFEYVFAISPYFRDLDVGMLIRLDLCISLNNPRFRVRYGESL